MPVFDAVGALRDSVASCKSNRIFVRFLRNLRGNCEAYRMRRCESMHVYPSKLRASLLGSYAIVFTVYPAVCKWDDLQTVPLARHVSLG